MSRSFIDSRSSSDPLRRRLRRLSPSERAEEANAFLDLYFREGDADPSDRASRQREVRRDLERHGFYRHTTEELAFGARVAWRNHGRCIGRHVWKALDVLDCRGLTEPDAVAAQTFRHLREADNGGDIRPTISVFAPVTGDQTPVWIESRQVAQYAGYLETGRVVGDPANVEMTRICVSLGWRPPSTRSHFDLLPLLLRDAFGRRLVYATPEGSVREIEIRHPHYPEFASLGLRWYAMPLVSDMILTIGGIDYPCAPFNGWYMATEIACRNLLDTYRYDLVNAVARCIGADTRDPLWKDDVVLELNRAVIASFRDAGVRLVDHHQASAQYLDFDRAERANGRMPSGDWAWIVPPQSSALCPVFHHAMTDLKDVPNFYRSRATDGADLSLSRVTEERGRILTRADNWRRRWRDWRRREI
ncbi:nitric oxide synthase oxygenase [Phenylobacterium sp.]|uniref:nitric oxide synthase oxygenase n=1 Tax=Phenylobacterium sp. TaxID=1871053 RepID=UPI00301E3799